MIPRPVHRRPSGSSARLGPGTTVDADSASLAVAELLRQELHAATGWRLPLVDGAHDGITPDGIARDGITPDGATRRGAPAGTSISLRVAPDELSLPAVGRRVPRARGRARRVHRGR